MKSTFKFLSGIANGEPANQAGSPFWLRNLVTLSSSVYVWWVICLVGASVYAWVDRHAMNPDGMSYLDMALETLKSGPMNLINGLWSPLYPALISVALSIFHPAPANVFPVVHLTNLFIFVVALLCFTFFVLSWGSVQDRKSANLRENSYLTPFCFGIFFWFTMEFTRPSNERPDLCVNAIVFLAAALCCRMSVSSRWRYFVALGFVLGLGYYAKSSMFPLALILLIIVFVLPPAGKGTRLKVTAAALTFLITSAPLMRAVPLSGRRIVQRICSSVVLPAPLGPSSANSSFARTSKLTLSSASVRPKRLLTRSISTAAANASVKAGLPD